MKSGANGAEDAMTTTAKKTKEKMFLHLPVKTVAAIRAGAAKAQCSLSEYVARIVEASK